MNLPNYFIADLPPEAELTPALITEACLTLRRNRERYLAGLSTEFVISVLVELAESWLDPNYPFRAAVLKSGPEALGFSAAVLRRGMDQFFKQITAEGLRNLIQQDLGDPRRLDDFVSSDGERDSRRAGMAVGPELLVHVTAGNLPLPGIQSILIGLLLRSAQFVKCSTGHSFFLRLFAHSLHELEPKIGSCLELAEWRGGNHLLEAALFESADCVTATGSDETLEKIRARIPSRTRFVPYGHRVSFGYVGQSMLSVARATKAAAAAARDVAAWDQQGCLSPHVIYVEAGGAVTPEYFAELLANALTEKEAEEPRGRLSAEQSAAIAYRRSFYEIRAAGNEGVKLFKSVDSTAWTVIHEPGNLFQVSCLNRFIYVKGAANLEEALAGADAARGKVSTVGIAAADSEIAAIAKALARWGATRVCPLGQMQNPSLLWRHDGRASLTELVTWTDLEKER
jgi:hypothetical protein